MTNHQQGKGSTAKFGMGRCSCENEDGIITDPELKQVYEAHIPIYLE